MSKGHRKLLKYLKTDSPTTLKYIDANLVGVGMGDKDAEKFIDMFDELTDKEYEFVIEMLSDIWTEAYSAGSMVYY